MRRSASYRDAVAWTSPDTCSHLSLTNGRGQHQGDLPRLLRRMATEIAKLGPDTMILDFVVHDEVDDLGSFFTATWRTGRRAVADDDDLHAVVRHWSNRVRIVLVRQDRVGSRDTVIHALPRDHHGHASR